MPLMRLQPGQPRAPRMPLLKKLFWAYFLLLIFEGALRKWIIPSLSGPLLLIRDPVAILIIWEAYRKHKWPEKFASIIGALSAGIVGLCLLQLVLGEGVWYASLYGLRSYLLPFPVAFIMAENLDADDLRKFATCTLWLLIPLTLLEIVQYSSPADSFWNKGASAGSEQLAYAGGHVRASATFSYVTGPTNYLPLAAVFIFFGLAKPGYIKRWLLWAASCALVLAVPVTGSRAAAYSLAGVVACVAVAALFGVSQFVKSLQVILPVAFIALLVSQLPIFSQASDTMTERFTMATASEGGSASQSLILRLVDPTVGSIEDNVSKGNWLGAGLGRGSVAILSFMGGAGFANAGESEAERVLGEFGWVGGIAFLLFRFLLAMWIAAKAIDRARDGQPLALLLLPLIVGTIVLGTLEQPTVQGFMVFSLAIALADIRGSSVPSVSASRQLVQERPRPRLRRSPVSHPAIRNRTL